MRLEAVAHAGLAFALRARPFLHNEGNICIERSDGLKKSFDYPSATRPRVGSRAWRWSSWLPSGPRVGPAVGIGPFYQQLAG